MKKKKKILVTGAYKFIRIYLLKLYLKKDRLNYKILKRGNLCDDMGTIERINETNSMIKNIQNRLCTAIKIIHGVIYLEKFIKKNLIYEENFF